MKQFPFVKKIYCSLLRILRIKIIVMIFIAFLDDLGLEDSNDFRKYKFKKNV